MLPILSRLGNPDQGSGQTSAQPGDAKNIWVKAVNCRYAYRMHGNEERILQLEYEFNKINLDIIGISETRRKQDDCVTFKSGHVLFCKGSEYTSNIRNNEHQF